MPTSTCVLFSQRVADAERELCDIAGFVVTKLVANGNYDPLFPEDWVAEQADDGTSFEIILVEKGYAKVRCKRLPCEYTSLPTLLSVF